MDQSSVVLYWHEADTLRWHCKGDDDNAVVKAGEGLSFRQSKCVVYLPPQALSIQADQTSFVMVRPQTSVDSAEHTITIDAYESMITPYQKD